MGFLDRLLRLVGKDRTPSATTTADQARSRQLAGRETGQTAAEQAGTRSRMEAELGAQRERRDQSPRSDA
jgi:hypothetical protein